MQIFGRQVFRDGRHSGPDDDVCKGTFTHSSRYALRCSLSAATFCCREEGLARIFTLYMCKVKPCGLTIRLLAAGGYLY